jgi:serine/threonine protein kinase
MAALAEPTVVQVGDLPKEGTSLGTGASGKVYEVKGDPTKIMKVVDVPLHKTEVKRKKVVDETQIKRDQDNIVSEFTIQKQLYAKVPGSCPEVYAFLQVNPEQFKDSKKVAQQYVIVMEKCVGADRLLKANPGNDDVVLDLLEQIATILRKAQRELKFNHRDLHLDNVMYKMVDGKPKFMLIDFGFACADIDGTRVESVGYSFTPNEKCFRESRDLAMLVYRTRKLADKIRLSETMKAFMKELLTFTYTAEDGTTINCDMIVPPGDTTGCGGAFIGAPDQEYKFLNRDGAQNPKMTPDGLLNEIKIYREKLPAKGSSRMRRTRRRGALKKQLHRKGRTRRLISSV